MAKAPVMLKDNLGLILRTFPLFRRLSFCEVSRAWLNVVNESVTHLTITASLALGLHQSWKGRDFLLASNSLPGSFLTRWPNLCYLNFDLPFDNTSYGPALTLLPPCLKTLKIYDTCDTVIETLWTELPYSLETFRVRYVSLHVETYEEEGEDESQAAQKSPEQLMLQLAERHGRTLKRLDLTDDLEDDYFGDPFFEAFMEHLPKISELYFTEMQPVEWCSKLTNVWEDDSFNPESHFRKVRANRPSATFLEKLADPRIKNLEKLEISDTRNLEKRFSIFVEIAKNNPQLRTFFWSRYFRTAPSEGIDIAQNLKNLTKIYFQTIPSAPEWAVLGKQLRKLVSVKISYGEEYFFGDLFNVDYMRAFVSEMPENHPLRIFDTGNSEVSQYALGKYLVPKCPNLEIAEGNSVWSPKAFAYWGACPCSLKRLSVDISKLDLSLFSEFLSKKGEAVLEIQLTGGKYNNAPISMETFEVLNLSQHCPTLQILTCSNVTLPMVPNFRNLLLDKIPSLRVCEQHQTL